MIRRPPRSTLLTHSFPTRRSSDLRTDSQAIEARTILLAQGVLNHQPRIPQETHDRGVAYGLIRYCPICDAYEVRGKRVAVLGCSEHGAAEAMFVRHYSE